MPIEGPPDPEVHRLCIRCKKWHHPAEGRMLGPPSDAGATNDPISSLVVGLRRLIVGPGKPRFICSRCYKIRKYTQLTVFVIFLVLVAAVLVMESLGVLH